MPTYTPTKYKQALCGHCVGTMSTVFNAAHNRVKEGCRHTDTHTHSTWFVVKVVEICYNWVRLSNRYKDPSPF